MLDCSNAGGVAALACADAGTSALDHEVARLYANAQQDAASSERYALEAAHTAWLAVRNDCVDAACLRAAYIDRIAALRMGDPALADDRDGISIGPVAYTCADGTSLVAVFVNGPSSAVHLALDDGRSLILDQGISGSGARYADEAAGQVFWIKGRNAMATLDGTQTDCSSK